MPHRCAKGNGDHPRRSRDRVKMSMQAVQISSTGNVETLDAKFERLRSGLRAYLEAGLLIAFSGGVDSAFLVWAAERERSTSGGRLLALTTSSASLATAERADVEKFACQYRF